MIKRRRLLFLFAGIVIICISVIAAYRYMSGSGYPVGSQLRSDGQNVHALRHFDRDTFYRGIEKASKDNTAAYPHHIRGGIIPHHLLAGFIIADFFQKLSAQKPAYIIIVGPNHKEQGGGIALTSRYGWSTKDGILMPEKAVIRELIGKKLVSADETVLPGDHAVSGIMPFIKYYLPDTRVVPILLSNSMNEEEVNSFALALRRYIQRDTVFIAAVDFSHYLTREKAEKNDSYTLDVMKRFDYRRLFSLGNGYLDSPPSIGLLLMSMELQGTTNMELLYNTNSGTLTGSDFTETTSYFSILYY